METLRRLHTILADIGRGRDINTALDTVAHAIVDVAGFGVACAHVVRGDEVVVAAVAGPGAARESLLGRTTPRAVWDRLLEDGEARGDLRFYADPRGLLDSMPYWVPPGVDEADGTEEWGPYNALLAPMWSATGELIGVLSVDQPANGWPSRTQQELLETFAAQTATALDNQRLAASLAAERHRLRTNEETLRLAFDNAPVGMCMVRVDEGGSGSVVRVNDAMCRLFGYTESEFAGLAAGALVDCESDRGLDAVLEAARTGSMQTYRGETRCRRADRSTFWGQVHLAVPPTSDDGESLLLAQIVDVTARHESEAELAHRAAHDPLTGLVNRTVIAERLAVLIDGSRDVERPGAVLFCDLDHFKQVNDAHGHLIGDEVLACVARRIAGIVRRSDTVGRYGGDEFLVIVPEISAEEARDLAIRVVHAVDEPILVGGTTYRVGASVGIVVLDDVRSASDALERADEAMYRAKARFGRDRYVVHEAR